MAEEQRKSNKRIIIVAAGIAIAAIAIAVLYAGFPAGMPPSNPFGPEGQEGPPRITMAHEGEEYDGQLLGYVYSERRSFLELPEVSAGNITSIPRENVIDIQQESEMRFTIEGNPSPEAQLDSLSVTAYTNDGEPVKVLDANGNPRNNTYSAGELEGGNQYILISTATWYPDERRETITGYVMYGYRIDISGS